MSKKQILVVAGEQSKDENVAANAINKVFDDFKFVPLENEVKKDFSKIKNLTINEIERNKPLYRTELVDFENQRRKENPYYWINKVLSLGDNIIVSDIHSCNELDILKKHKAITVKLETDSEKWVKNDIKWDYIINNYKSIEELKEKAYEIAKKIEKTIKSSKKIS